MARERTLRRRLLLAPLAAAPLVLAMLLFLAPAAEAHSVLLHTVPDESATVASAPNAVQLIFNERPQGRFSVVQITGPDGTRRDSGHVSVTNDTVSEAFAGTRPAGRYTVDWRVVSADGHPVSGQFGFTATASAAPIAAPKASPIVASSSSGSPLRQHFWHAVVPTVIVVALLFGLPLVARLTGWGQRNRPGS